MTTAAASIDESPDLDFESLLGGAEDEPEDKSAKAAPARDDDSVRQFLDAIGGGELLTRDEERVLARRIRQGDLDARNELVERNLRLVVSIAKRYQGYGLELLDLIQIGSEGLMHAISKFDPERFGTKLSTYAVPWIEQYIQRGLSNEGRTIRIPVHRGIEMRNVLRAEARLSVGGAEPSEDEVARHLETTPEAVAELRRMAQPIASLDKAVADGDATLAAFVEVEGATSDALVLEEEMTSNVADALASLPPHTRLVLELRYGLGDAQGAEHSLAAVSARLGITRDQVRRLEKEAMRALASEARLAALSDDEGRS